MYDVLLHIYNEIFKYFNKPNTEMLDNTDTVNFKFLLLDTGLTIFQSIFHLASKIRTQKKKKTKQALP